MNRRRILLRREHVNAKHITLHKAEKRRTGISGPGGHESANIDISSSDLSSKRREDLLETLNFLELLQVRFRRLIGLFVLIVLLFGYHVFLDQIAPAISGQFGYLFLRARLCKLLIHLRCRNLRQQLASLHVVADIDLPAFDVSVGPRENCRLIEGLEGSRQN